MSNLRRVGLPDAMRMRHDNHFVDQLGRPGGAPVGRLIPIEDIDPNPNQPRHAMGDLSELIASVREKGILEPILVRPRGNRFQIIAGERRFRAAGEAQLVEIPCIVRETPDAEMMELALIENLQRKDLTAFEEADGLLTLKDRLQTLGNRYEFVIVDTPPALGLITVNALVAATHLLIPVQSSYFALEGTDDLLETVEKIRSRPNPNLKLLGAVITLHDKRTTLSRDVQKAIADVFGDRVFQTMISKSIRLEESPAHKESIFTFAPQSSGAYEYYRLCEEVIERV